MATFFIYKIRTTCAECGEGILVEGPRGSIPCDGCQSVLEMPPKLWKSVLSLREAVTRLALTEGKTRGSALLTGERKLDVLWGPQRPLCGACHALLDLTLAPPGTTGELRCACGQTTSTAPPPAWLLAEDPSVLQIFGAPPEVPAGSKAVGVGSAARPISFACPDCGANLKITAEAPRVLPCSFCQANLYLPDPLWRALHPTKKRTPFYVAFR